MLMVFVSTVIPAYTVPRNYDILLSYSRVAQCGALCVGVSILLSNELRTSRQEISEDMLNNQREGVLYIISL
jgi:hypothetical protein